jgi:hypothetical protein
VGLFSRSSGGGRRPFSTATPEDLRRLGEMWFGGDSVTPPGASAIPVAELDGYAIAFLMAAGYPASGSPAESEANGQFLDELTAAAERGGDWGFVGAMCVAWNCVAPAHQGDARALAILDRALEALRTDGVSHTAVPPFAIDRWTSVHGYGEIGPAGWPSPLEYLPVPAAEEAPPVEDLADGEARKLAQAPAAPANMIFAERRPDGLIQAVIEGAHPDTGAMRRWDWEGVGAADYPSFLRELGDRLVTRRYWAHDDLTPYFPCRQRSRDQLRAEARAQALQWPR